MTPPGTLYLIGPEPDANDWLDPIEAARPQLAEVFRDIFEVRPATRQRLRSLRRRFRAGVDAALFDFSRPADMAWAEDAPAATAGLVLISGEGWPVPAKGRFHAAQRYKARSGPELGESRAAILDGADATNAGLVRPLAQMPALESERAFTLFCGLGGVNAAYRAMKAAHGRRIHVVCKTGLNADRLAALNLRLGGAARITTATSRRERLQLAASASHVVEADPTLLRAASDAELGARAAGVSYGRIGEAGIEAGEHRPSPQIFVERLIAALRGAQAEAPASANAA